MLRSRPPAVSRVAACLAACAALLAGCGGAVDRPVRDSAAAVTTPVAAPGHPAVVDSALPREEEMRRFVVGLGPAPTALRGGTTSRDALVRRFVRALEARDTAGLRALRIDRAEFAALYYPTTPLARPPYDLSPALMWFQLEGNGGKGLTHALEERGGRPLHVVGYRCGRTDTEGENRVHTGCVLRRLQAPGDTVEESLFGAIVERGGRFKFVSFANRL